MEHKRNFQEVFQISFREEFKGEVQGKRAYNVSIHNSNRSENHSDSKPLSSSAYRFLALLDPV